MSDVLGVRSCRAGPGDKPLTRGGSRLEKAAVVGAVGPRGLFPLMLCLRGCQSAGFKRRRLSWIIWVGPIESQRPLKREEGRGVGEGDSAEEESREKSQNMRSC